MEFQNIKKVNQGKFITRYDVTYKTIEDTEKVYEMISRNPEITEFKDLADHPVDSVVLIMHDRTGEKILINKEFRMPCGGFVYNFPAGLIDPGEDYMQSAKRELWEETGLQIVEVKDVLYDSFSAIGFSNEKNVCVVGVADGEFSPSTSAVEEIEAKWYTKEEVRELLKDNYFAARTQAYVYLWSRS
ncbi:MAG: NUDIX hydrolase [Lachnospiraceae bacterium]|nr:NUDIX hydrolase [Lachnospiraceae bacterium]